MVKYQNVAGDLDEAGRQPPVEQPPEERHLRRRPLEWPARGGTQNSKKLLLAARLRNHSAAWSGGATRGEEANGEEGAGKKTTWGGVARLGPRRRYKEWNGFGVGGGSWEFSGDLFLWEGRRKNENERGCGLVCFV